MIRYDDHCNMVTRRSSAKDELCYERIVIWIMYCVRRKIYDEILSPCAFHISDGSLPSKAAPWILYQYLELLRLGPLPAMHKASTSQIRDSSSSHALATPYPGMIPESVIFIYFRIMFVVSAPVVELTAELIQLQP